VADLGGMLVVFYHALMLDSILFDSIAWVDSIDSLVDNAGAEQSYYQGGLEATQEDRLGEIRGLHAQGQTTLLYRCVTR